VTLSQPRPSASSHQAQQPVTKDDLGRASWVFLHTLAAQFPEHPTRQQQRDARQLMDSFARVYPCADCAAHFQEIVK
jgi:FAD-linked sulfhydryl oxidase